MFWDRESVAGIVGYSWGNTRICGSNASTTDPVAGRECRGAEAAANAARGLRSKRVCFADSAGCISKGGRNV